MTAARLRRSGASVPWIATRIEALNWQVLAAGLDAEGYAIMPSAGLYATGERFRSRVVMARHGFGRGEYQYFAYPLPDVVAAVRGAL
jgi:uncharacterized protein